MSTELFRKYIDIINENQQPQMLDEGMMDMAKSLASKFMKSLGKDAIADIATKVKQVTGGDYTPSKENAIKVAQAFGFDKMDPKEVAEGLAGNWQGRLIQMIHAGIVGGGIASILNHPIGGSAGGAPAGFLILVGIVLLMAVGAFWGDAPGQVGRMGKYGNKGWEAN